MRRYVVFITAGFSLLMYSIDSTAVAVALPNFLRDFGTNVLWAGWTISIYLIAVTTMMPLAGNLSDAFGRKKFFLISLIVFTCSSILCGLSPNIYALVVFRFLQGIGGACFLPTAAGIVSDHFPESRETAIGLFTSIFPIGGIIGPNLGGWIVSQYSWRYIFYINLPIGITLILLNMILLRDSKVRPSRHVDIVGISFFSLAVLLLMFGLNLIGENFSVSALFIAIVFCTLSFICFSLFLRRQRKEASPMFDIALLGSKPFLAANVYNLLIGAGVWGLFSFIPLYVTSVHGLSTLLSGMILTPRSIGIILTSTTTSFLLRRWGYRGFMVLGLGIVSLSILLIGEGPQLSSMLGIRIGMAEVLASLVMLSGIGTGIAMPASNNACIELMPDKVATITGLRGMFRAVGGALGISLITLILHACSNPARGFRIVFISFGLGLLCTIPLTFFLPSGKREV